MKEFRESYDLQLSKYKEEIARVAKNEIELRQQFSSQVSEVTKRLEDDNRQKIQHMHEEHEQKSHQLASGQCIHSDLQDYQGSVGVQGQAAA